MKANLGGTLSAARAIIVVCIGKVPSDIEAEWNRWYDTTHAPARLALPGFIGARRFLVQGGECSYLTLYEVESVGAVQSEDYLALKRRELAKPTTSMEARTLRLPGLIRGVYRDVDPDTDYVMPDSDVLMMVAYDIPPRTEDEFASWYRTKHLPALAQDPGVVCARRFKRAEWADAPASQGAIPPFVTLYDLRDVAALDSATCRQAVDAPYVRTVLAPAKQITRLFAPQRSRSIS